MMRHFLTTADWTRLELEALLERAAQFRKKRIQREVLKDKAVALVFFNPSLRTRTSFELGADQLGAKAVVLEPGKGSWPIEFEDHVVMDREPEEHVKEVAQVLSRYVDLIGVRAFPKFVDWKVDREDRAIRQFARYSTVPVMNMETITHPCQELALMRALIDQLPDHKPDGKKFVLTWTYHPKPLNTAVANSALLIAGKFGMDVTLLCPNEQYILDERYMNIAGRNAAESGGSLTVTHDIESAYKDADVVYAKSWGALPYFGNWEAEKPMRERYRHFIVDETKMALTAGGGKGLFSHCLPIRRNIKATDAVLDSPTCFAIDEAENRLHVQKAVMERLAAEAAK